MTRHLLLSSLVLALLAGGCRASYSPRDAASERVRFLRQHGSSLTPAQVRLIHQVPYQSRSSDRSRMNSILRGEETGERAFGQRRRLLDRHGVKVTLPLGNSTPDSTADGATKNGDDTKKDSEKKPIEDERKPESGEDDSL